VFQCNLVRPTYLVAPYNVSWMFQYVMEHAHYERCKREKS
jgi:hypothetical protein